MATPPLLDFQELIAPIPGDDPAGTAVPRDILRKLEEDRREENPDDYGPNDPIRPETFKRANWGKIIATAKDLLTRSSKDLLAAVRLTEALFQQDGFAGLRDGLRLLREMVDNCWDRMYPLIEDNDLEPRENLFHWLDDPYKGARMPSKVRLAPLVSRKEASKEEKYGWSHWKSDSMDPKNRVSREDFQKAVQQTSVTEYTTVIEDIGQCLEEVNHLTHSLTERMGQTAPGLTALREAIQDCKTLMEQVGKLKGVSLVSEPGANQPQAEAVTANGAATAAGGAPRALASREDAYHQLEQAAALLQRLEPHSPIPYLIQRAVELGKLPFPQLMKALIREPNVIAELSRELGLAEAPASEGMSE